MTKSLFIRTHGCQMNVHDSERMADVLKPLGFGLVDSPDGADMVILNTCHIREKASEKVFSELGRLRSLKNARREAGRDMTLAVAGCVAQAEGAEILRRAPYVDMVFGPQSYHKLPEMVARAERAGGKILETDFPSEDKFDHLPTPNRIERGAAFLTVQEGCDKFCAFCVVPYTRGAEYSRPVAKVLAEARDLVRGGAREITLLGQNVNAYHGEAENGAAWSLGRLIRELAEIDGLDRLRYTTSYPAEVDDDLISAHRDVPALMPFLHLPVQSGSDRVLKAMNRRHDRRAYVALVQKLREARPDLALSSDFIVGFPGEREHDFEDTMSLVEEVGFVHAYSFIYSPRPGTPAAMMDMRVDPAVKSRRLRRLQALLNDQRAAFNKSCIGRRFDIPFDRPGRRPGQLVGRSPYMQPVHVSAPGGLLGTVARVTVVDGHPNSLSATLDPGGAERPRA